MSYEHSPLPWTLDEDIDSHDNPSVYVCSADDELVYKQTISGRENAELIVKCVNAFPDLFAACDAAKERRKP